MDLLIGQVKIMIISIIIDPVKDTVLKRGNFPVIVEKVGSNWGGIHTIMGMIASNRGEIVIINVVQHHCLLEQKRKLIRNYSER